MRQAQLLRNTILSIVLLGFASEAIQAEPFLPGEISPNFTLPDRAGNPVSLTDYEGHIVVLDFFAFWCAPCSVSSPDIEKQIQKHYEEAGGNPSGIPVQVLSINLERESPPSTDQFVATADLDRVIDDFDQTAWNLYNRLGSRPSIPLFVIINGVTNSSSHKPWEILHSQHGMYVLPNAFTANTFRTFIDAVTQSPATPQVLVNPFKTLPPTAGGWKTSSWFGRINDRFFPWVFHDDLGWLQIQATEEAPSALYFYQTKAGWRFTSPNEFPQAFDFERRSWIEFDLSDNSGSVPFYDHSQNQWLNHNSRPF